MSRRVREKIEDDKIELSAPQDKRARVRVMRTLRYLTKGAAITWLLRRSHVMAAPGTPEKIHFLTQRKYYFSPALINTFNSLPGLKYGTLLAGISTGSPVFGLRPRRAPR